MPYLYKSANLGGNLHEAAAHLNEMGVTDVQDIDVVAMHSVGGTTTVVVWREVVSRDKLRAHVDAYRARVAEGRVKR